MGGAGCPRAGGGRYVISMIKYEPYLQERPVAEIERLTITLPAEMAALVRGAVDEGNYASSSEVIREALRDWKTKRALQLQELEGLKADIDRGLTDLAEGRVEEFDTARIIERGRTLLAGRSRSA